MAQEQVTIQAKDGACQAWVLTPAGQGPWPAVIMYMDAFGIRPAMIEMAQHIADQGYLVLLPDLFYRFGPYGPHVPKELFKGDFRAVIGPQMASSNNHLAADDTAGFLAYLDTRPDVKGDKVATVGFCMGGGMAITAAGFHPERVAAAASFHGGRLATDDPTSPHLQLPQIQAELLIAAADNDQTYPPEMAERFQAALQAVGVRHTHELYEGKLHGWMKPDMPVYDPEAAARGWKQFFGLLERNL